jgi:hypothetical protein
MATGITWIEDAPPPGAHPVLGAAVTVLTQSSGAAVAGAGGQQGTAVQRLARAVTQQPRLVHALRPRARRIIW